MSNRYLKQSIVYLSGAMDAAPDLGIGWRDKFTNLAQHLDLDIIDPCKKPPNCSVEVQDGHRVSQTLRDSKNWSGMQSFVKRLRREDLRFVDISDFLVVYIDPDVPSYGTPDEVYTAERQKKPLFCIVKGGIERLPVWLFGVFETHEIFSTVEECVAHLEKIDSGEIPLDDRWVLIRDYLEQM